MYFSFVNFYCIVDINIIKICVVMKVQNLPAWLLGLSEEDLAFLKQFLLASGSLKKMAFLYGVSYPTVRLRLDRLIQKIHLAEEHAEEPYVALIKDLVMDDKLGFDTAKTLIMAYRREKETEK